MRKKSLIEANFKSISNLFHVSFGLFRSARASWNTSVRPSVSPSARKIWITYIQAYMPQESSEDSSNQPDGPMGSPRCPLDPLGPPGPPHRPPMTLKQVSWPHWTLKITSPAFQIIRNPIKCHCWSYRTSYPSPLTPWDPKGLPLDPLVYL